jgi:CRP-like cAMP-binding protein
MSLSTPKIPAEGIVANLSEEDRDTLSSYGSFHLAQVGAVLIEQGQSHGKLFFTLSGLMHARRVDGGNDILLGRIEPGEWVGEIDLFDPSSAVCSVVAVEPSQYWVISREDLEDFLNNYNAAGIMLMIGLATTLSQRIRGITAKLAEQADINKFRDMTVDFE